MYHHPLNKGLNQILMRFEDSQIKIYNEKENIFGTLFIRPHILFFFHVLLLKSIV